MVKGKQDHKGEAGGGLACEEQSLKEKYAVLRKKKVILKLRRQN